MSSRRKFILDLVAVSLAPLLPTIPGDGPTAFKKTMSWVELRPASRPAFFAFKVSKEFLVEKDLLQKEIDYEVTRLGGCLGSIEFGLEDDDFIKNMCTIKLTVNI